MLDLDMSYDMFFFFVFFLRKIDFKWLIFGFKSAILVKFRKKKPAEKSFYIKMATSVYFKIFVFFQKVFFCLKTSFSYLIYNFNLLSEIFILFYFC